MGDRVGSALDCARGGALLGSGLVWSSLVGNIREEVGNYSRTQCSEKVNISPGTNAQKWIHRKTR